MDGLKNQNPGDRQVLTDCDSCGSKAFRDVAIHSGRSTRRDCAKCNRTMGFPVWHPDELENSSTSGITKTDTTTIKDMTNTTTTTTMTSDITTADAETTADLTSLSKATKPAISPALITEINIEHEACLTAANDTLSHALRCGELLLQAKSATPHGEWEAWVAKNFHGSVSTAKSYKRLAENREVLEAKRQSSAVLSIDGALALIKKPRPATSKSQVVAHLATDDIAKINSHSVSELASKNADEVITEITTKAKLSVDRARPGSEIAAGKCNTLVASKAGVGTGTKIVANAAARARPPKIGGEIVAAKDKKAALSAVGQLWRLLRPLDLQRTCESHLEFVEGKIRNLADTDVSALNWSATEQLRK
jgi:hypothetical protein